MALRTGKQYREDLRKQSRTIYAYGEKITGDWTEHPLISPIVNCNELTFDLPHEPEYKEIMTATSHLTGDTINRFTQIFMDKEDFINRFRTGRIWQLSHASCHAARCAGGHAMNALYDVTYKMDQDLGTNYHERLKDFVREVHEKDLAVSGMVTDAKGNRSKSPSQQDDPDMFLRVVEKRKDGIIIRGAKAHQSQAVVADYQLIAPTVILRENETDYAVCCAVPTDAPGIIHIMEWPSGNQKRLDPTLDIDCGNLKYGVHGSSLVIFDDVFVPWERVFMCGETQYCLQLLGAFSRHQRIAAAGCKMGAVELMCGAAAVVAEYNGLDWKKTTHIRDKIMEMVRKASLVRGCAIGAIAMAEKGPSGVLLPDPLLANAAKLETPDVLFECSKWLLDIAGGLVATMPSEKDLSNPETGKYLRKYLKGREDIPVEDRLRIFRFIEYISGMSFGILPTGIHTGGSPEVQRLYIRMLADIDSLKKRAKNLAGIRDA